MEQTTRYSAEWVAEQVREKNAGWLPNHDCAICGQDVGYIFDQDEVWFRSGCGCSWSPDRPTNFHGIADWLAMQKSVEVRDRIMARLS